METPTKTKTNVGGGLRGTERRVRHLFYVDTKSKELLVSWGLSANVISQGDLIDRMTRFCKERRFDPAKTKNWTGK